MRPRINGFGRITRKELDSYLVENQVYGFTVSIEHDVLVYTYNIMFRENKRNPEKLFVKVSSNSKLVLSAYTDRGRTFKNVNELKQYTKR